MLGLGKLKQVLIAWLTISISLVGVILIPLLILTFKIIRKGTIIEQNQINLIEDVKKLVQDKDKVHAEMLSQMREDRMATDRRLRWLEEHLWRKANS
jgi:hypothetical protein